MCKRGFHKWEFDPRKQFDVKQGKLVSRQTCVRCGATAHYSQRISGGAAQVEVGDADVYEARCRSCYVPYEP